MHVTEHRMPNPPVSPLPLGSKRGRVGRVGAAFATIVPLRVSGEVATSGHGGGDLLPCPLRLRVAHAAAAFSTMADRPLPADPVA